MPKFQNGQRVVFNYAGARSEMQGKKATVLDAEAGVWKGITYITIEFDEKLSHHDKLGDWLETCFMSEVGPW